MTTKPELYENYPWSTVITYKTIMGSIFISGLFLTYLINPFLSLAFFLYLLYMEFSVYKEGCQYCYYYGKRCFSGRGLIVKHLYKKGDPKVFCARTMEFKDFLPHMVVAFVPAIAAGYLFFTQGLDLVYVGVGIWPLLVNFVGNQFIYGQMACPHCKQGAKCCPAVDYFMKKQKK